MEEVAQQVDELHHNAHVAQKNIDPVHDRFLGATRQKLKSFAETIQEFHQRFGKKGPDAVGEDLEKGILLVQVIIIRQNYLMKTFNA